MKYLSTFLLAFSLLFSQLPAPVLAQGSAKNIVCQNVKDAACKATTKGSAQALIESVLNILFYVVGAASVIVIIVGALMYVLSNGDPKNTNRAKDAILYALVGIAIAMTARAIVAFVLSNV